MAEKFCHSRFDDGTYLQTCLKPKGHSGQHEGDNGITWTNEQGWWDKYGDSPERAKPDVSEVTD